MLKMIFKFGFFFWAVSLWPAGAWAYSAGGLCLHPLEQAALLQGNAEGSSRKNQLKKAEDRLETLREQIEQIEEGEDGIEDMKDKLAESLTKDDVDVYPGDMADVIAEYMEGQQDDFKEDLSNMELKDKNKQDIDLNDDKSDLEALPWYEDSDEYFKSNGRIKSRAFCSEHSTNSSDCQDSLEELEQFYEELAHLREEEDRIKELLRDMKRQQRRIDAGLEEDEDTEAGGLCFDCLDAIRELDKPTTGQTVGNVLAVLAGGALSYYGYRSGRRFGREINDLRLRQGFGATSTAGLSWAGLGMGLPFISGGVYGLVGGNSQFGNWACSPGFAGGAGMYSPFGHYGANAYAAYGGHNPWGGGPWAGGGLQFGGGPWGGSPWAGGGLQFGGGPWGGGGPWAGGGLQFGGGFGGGPWGGGPWAGGGLQFGGGPWGGGPWAGGGLQFGGGFGGGPWAGGGLQFGGGPWAGGGLQFGGGPWGGGPWAGGGLQFGGGPRGGGGLYQQQQYSQYLQFQQSQMQARLQAQQAWLQHQQAVQKDWMNRQQVIGGLTQELYRIQQQIQLVASGGLSGNGLLGASSGSLTAGANLGSNLAGSAGPTHSPAPGAGTETSGDWEVTTSR